MVTSSQFFGTKQFILENSEIRLTLLAYGARIQSLVFREVDVVMGFDTLEDYKRDTRYLGASIGRYANRIEGGTFSLGEKRHILSKNENESTTLHGGKCGFDRFEWDAKVLDEYSVEFSRISPHGEMGFPGNLSARIVYSLSGSAVSISYFASSDSDTVYNPTNHAYFNLGGIMGEDCREMILQLDSKEYLPIDSDLIPTGEIRTSSGTDFDFQKPKKIARDFDHCFVLSDRKNQKRAGSLYSEKTKIKMEIETDLPGIQLYTCEHFSDSTGKGGVPLHDHHAVALETQFFPNSPNIPSFPSCALPAGKEFCSTTKYIFSQEKFIAG